MSGWRFFFTVSTCLLLQLESLLFFFHQAIKHFTVLTVESVCLVSSITFIAIARDIFVLLLGLCLALHLEQLQHVLLLILLGFLGSLLLFLRQIFDDLQEDGLVVVFLV